MLARDNTVEEAYFETHHEKYLDKTCMTEALRPQMHNERILTTRSIEPERETQKVAMLSHCHRRIAIAIP